MNPLGGFGLAVTLLCLALLLSACAAAPEAAQAGATASQTPAVLVQEPARQLPLGLGSLIGLAFLLLAAWLNRRGKRS